MVDNFIQIKESFNNPLVKKIVNVYQTANFINGSPPGLGDYLRGSICLYQSAKLLNLEFDMDFKTHPISHFIQVSEDQKNYNVNNSQLYRFENLNYTSTELGKYHTDSVTFLRDFVNHLNSLNETNPNLKDGIYYLFCNSFPIFPKYSEQAIANIQSKLIPMDLMIENIEKKMNALGVTPKDYNVIHIRCGDSFILDPHKASNNDNNTVEHGSSIKTKSTFIIKILYILTRYLDKNKKYVILSDNNEVKLFIKRRFPNCCIIQTTPIVHMGQSITMNTDGIMHTLLDFYIMSNANNILSLSGYTWGSGFSKWCSVIFNVPYKTYNIN